MAECDQGGLDGDSPRECDRDRDRSKWKGEGRAVGAGFHKLQGREYLPWIGPWPCNGSSSHSNSSRSRINSAACIDVNCSAMQIVNVDKTIQLTASLEATATAACITLWLSWRWIYSDIFLFYYYYCYHWMLYLYPMAKLSSIHSDQCVGVRHDCEFNRLIAR